MSEVAVMSRAKLTPVFLGPKPKDVFAIIPNLTTTVNTHIRDCSQTSGFECVKTHGQASSLPAAPLSPPMLHQGGAGPTVFALRRREYRPAACTPCEPLTDRHQNPNKGQKIPCSWESSGDEEDEWDEDDFGMPLSNVSSGSSRVKGSGSGPSREVD